MTGVGGGLDGVVKIREWMRLSLQWKRTCLCVSGGWGRLVFGEGLMDGRSRRN